LITSLLFARGQSGLLSCGLFFGGVCAKIGGGGVLQVLGKALKVALLHGCGKTHLCGNVGIALKYLNDHKYGT